jgi:cardiolipin synthase
MRQLAIIGLILAVAGCISEPEQITYPTLEGKFATAGDISPLVADQAYISDDEFFVRYSQDGRRYYGGGRWSNRIDIIGRNPGGSLTGPFILPLEYRNSEPWPVSPQGHKPVTILDSNDWHELRKQLLDSFVPAEERAGMVLHFETASYFLYYDENGDFRSTIIENKPGDYKIIRHMGIAEIVAHGLPMLEKYLNAKGIDARRIAFNTGDFGFYSLPFVYVNRDLPIVVFVRQPGPAYKFRTAGSSEPYLQTAAHVAGSHTVGILLRPVSSLYRLMFITTDTVIESTNPEILIRLDRTPIPPVSQGPGMDLVAWEERLNEMTNRASSKGTIEMLIDGEAFFTRFIDAVSSADKSISLRTYIFDNDDYAARIGRLLKRRSNEGIDVKILLDGLGTIVSTIEKQQTLPEGFSGPASVREFLESDSRVDVRQASNPWLSGDHVKTAIIDRRIAFTGGMNIAREYRYDWHDLMVELRGPVVDSLQFEFEKAWAHAGFSGDLGYFLRRIRRKPDDAEDVGVPVRVLFTRAGNSEIFRVQREAVRTARRYIYVENAYFTDDAMLYELARARRRGVDVRVIMPLITDRGLITRNNALAANVLLEHGIRVFIYPGMSHVKAAVFDGWVCLGSANWDRWSLRINKELNIASSEPLVAADLEEKLFRADFNASVELLEPFPERWSDHLLELVGDYIF